MKNPLYVIGSEPLHEWECSNNFPSCIILTGNVSADMFSAFARDFDYTKYKQISFDALTVKDIQYKDDYSCTYEEYLSQFVCGDAIRLFVLIKLYLNLHITKSFVVSEECVYSADHKTLIHAPEATELVVLPFVEHIGNGACCGYDKMSRVKLNDGLKSIGKWSFVGTDINNLELPHSVVSLGENAFLMSELENIRLSDSLNGIPDGCFDLCSLNSIKIPPSIKFIGNKALRGLTWTDEIKIPEGVERIGYDAFEAMHYVYLPASLMEIAPDFYYEECIDDPNYPPYIEVHPDNKVFFLKMEVCISKKRGLLLLIVNIMVLINTV
ncbi:MAG: leucine-rich repeat domain-containing protein [Prevotella sp.]